MASFLDSVLRPSKASRRYGKSGFAESTLQEIAWQRTRSAGLRWAIAGAFAGALGGLVAFAPATWLAGAVSSLTDARVLLTDARGTIWNGDAVAVLSGGADSRSAASLPGRLTWTLRPAWGSLNLRFRHDCCVNGEPTIRIQPGFGRTMATLVPDTGSNTLGQWPAAWLTGLGTPWNTIQPTGVLRITSPGLAIERTQGRIRFAGEAAFDVSGAASRMSTLPVLGSYRVNLRSDAATGSATVNLTTTEGPLRLTGQGQWTDSGLRFRGEGRADSGQEEALSNLLNIIGRRQGALSVIAIG
jgi:general secretion pathway protein N